MANAATNRLPPQRYSGETGPCGGHNWVFHEKRTLARRVPRRHRINLGLKRSHVGKWRHPHCKLYKFIKRGEIATLVSWKTAKRTASPPAPAATRGSARS